MENNNELQFQKERDFSGIFSDLFYFYKYNYKRLFYLLLIFAGPFFLIDGVINAYFQSFIYDFSTIDPYVMNSNPFEIMSRFFAWYGVIMLMKVVGYSFVTSITYAYITLCAQKGSQFDINEVRPLAFSYFFPFLLASVLITLVILIGFVFCILPGIYLGICLCFIFMIMIWERKSIGDAFSRCFQIAHKDFWWTLLILLAVSVGIGIVGFILALPMTIVTFLGTFSKLTGDVPSYFFPISLIVTSITNVVMSLLSSVTMVAVALQYFNIVEIEKKNRPV